MRRFHILVARKAVKIGLLFAVVFALFANAGEAQAKRRVQQLKRPNMPPGWSWPPNKQMAEDGKVCLAKLDELGVKYKKAAKQRKIATPIIVPDMKLGGVELVSLWRKGPFVMDCHLAAAIAEKGGPALREVGVKKVVFSSIYVYRNVSGKRALSRHALGLAMDVYRFVTDDDAEHIVQGDYLKGDKVLLDIESGQNATGSFRMLLTPGNDRGHYDHFHFEARTPRDRIETPPPRVKPPNA